WSICCTCAAIPVDEVPLKTAILTPVFLGAGVGVGLELGRADGDGLACEPGAAGVDPGASNPEASTATPPTTRATTTAIRPIPRFTASSYRRPAGRGLHADAEPAGGTLAPAGLTDATKSENQH